KQSRFAENTPARSSRRADAANRRAAAVPRAGGEQARRDRQGRGRRGARCEYENFARLSLTHSGIARGTTRRPWVPSQAKAFGPPPCAVSLLDFEMRESPLKKNYT